LIYVFVIVFIIPGQRQRQRM